MPDGNFDTYPVQFGNQSGKQLPLLIVIRRHHFARCKMTEQSLQGDMGQGLDILDQVNSFAVHRAAASHAGIDFHVNR